MFYIFVKTLICMKKLYFDKRRLINNVFDNFKNLALVGNSKGVHLFGKG